MSATSNLDRYRRISTLGAGGMGTVVLAEDTMLGRQVALKRLYGVDDLRAVSRLRREALVGASLSHPNLVAVYDVITSEDGELVIVMEYVEGETLAAALQRQGKLAEREILRILAGVAAGLDAIHAQGIVHRDVKPANILLGADGAVKVADLGIASAPDRTRITSTGDVLGSLSYMAPEQLEDGEVTPAIDVYALAAVTFEMLSGQKARHESHAIALAHAIATQPPPDLGAVLPTAPADVVQLLTRAMSRDPSARPHSAGEFVGRLRAAFEPADTAEVAPPAPVLPEPTPTPKPEPMPVVTAEPSPAPKAEPVPAPPPQAKPTPRTARPAKPPTRDGGRAFPGRWAVAALLALVAAAVLVAVLLNSGGNHSTSNGQQAAKAGKHSGGSGGTSGKTSTGRRGSAASSAGGAGAASSSSTATPAQAGSPIAAVETFYRLGAAHRYPDAWALADPALQGQLGGLQSFESGMQADRYINFNSARVVSQSGSTATVALKTTSVRTDGTQHCSGTADLLRGSASGTWLVHQIHINCA